MKKRGQIDFRIALYILIAVVFIGVLFFSFNSINRIEDTKSSVELLNLKTSIETSVLQQSARSEGSTKNFSFSVPASVAKLCFFDANKEYDELRNPEVSGLFGDDKVNNLFVFSDEGFFAYGINKLDVPAEKNPLCIVPKNNRFTLKLDSIKQKAVISASGGTEGVDCVSVVQNGDPDDKIDIVFLGYGFSDNSEYQKQISRYVNNVLLGFEPYSEYKNKFNFYRVDDADIECEIGSFIKCDNYGIKEAASNCPNDEIVVLVDRSVFSDILKPVRSSAIGNIVKINTADKPFVLVHELGHSIGDLADEYVDENYYSTSNFNADEYINCDSSPCSSWSSIDGTDCYEGCSLGRYFRPTENSVMRSLNSGTYGPVNERELVKRLLYYE